jgi:hypothetical protein
VYGNNIVIMLIKANTYQKKRKYSTQSRVGGMAQVIEHLTNKCEALSSNPSTTERERERGKHKKVNATSLENAIILQ